MIPTLTGQQRKLTYLTERITEIEEERKKGRKKQRNKQTNKQKTKANQRKKQKQLSEISAYFVMNLVVAFPFLSSMPLKNNQGRNENKKQADANRGPGNFRQIS